MKNLIYIIFLLIPFQGFTQYLHGTAIAYGIQNNKVYLGTDSKVSDQYGIFMYNMNKISHANNYTWAFSGMYQYEKIYNPRLIIDSLVKKNLGFKKTMQEITKVFIHKLNIVSPYLRIHTKNVHFEGKKHLNDLFICTYENNKLVYEAGTFKYEKIGNTWKAVYVKVEDENKLNKKNNSLNLNLFGSNKSHLAKINQFQLDSLTRVPKFKLGKFNNFHFGLVENLVYYLIYLETIKNPKEVGSPIQVIEISNNSLIPKISD